MNYTSTICVIHGNLLQEDKKRISWRILWSNHSSLTFHIFIHTSVFRKHDWDIIKYGRWGASIHKLAQILSKDQVAANCNFWFFTQNHNITITLTQLAPTYCECNWEQVIAEHLRIKFFPFFLSILCTLSPHHFIENCNYCFDSWS